MRTVAEYLEKAEAFQQLAAIATSDLLRTSYLDLKRDEFRLIRSGIPESEIF
jgi:hypothetical protein